MLTSLFFQAIQRVLCLTRSQPKLHCVSPSPCPLASLGPIVFILGPCLLSPSFPNLISLCYCSWPFSPPRPGHVNSPHPVLFLPHLSYCFLPLLVFRFLMPGRSFLCHSCLFPTSGSTLSNGNPGKSLTDKGDHNRRLKTNKCRDRQEQLEFLGRIKIPFTRSVINTQRKDQSQSSNDACCLWLIAAHFK